MASKKTSNVFNAQFPSGIAFIGAILIGLAVGILMNNVRPYLLLGVGVGFVLVALLAVMTNNKRLNR